MRIKVTEEEKRKIENYEMKPLWYNDEIIIYGAIEFEEIEEKSFWGKQTNIYLTKCVMRIAEGKEEKSFSYGVTDECKEFFLIGDMHRIPKLDYARIKYFEIRRKIDNFDKLMKKIKRSKDNEKKRKN